MLDSEKAQCASDGDCTSKGAAFEGTYCEPSTKVCVNSLAYCRTNAECIDRNGNGPFICHKDTHTCHSILSVDCPKLYSEANDLRNDDVVITGAVIIPSFHQGLKAADLSVELARRELKNVGFLPGVNGGARRPLVIISCDPAPPRNDEQMKALAKHLVEEARVSTYIAPLESARAAAMLQVTIPAGVPGISPIGNSATLDNLPGRKDLYYQVCPSDSFLLSRGVRFIDKFFEPKLRKANPPILPPEKPFKIALLRDSTSSGTSSEKIFFDSAVVNGVNLAKNFADGNYKIFNIGDPRQSNFQSTTATAVQQIIDNEPHFILVGGGDGAGSTSGGTAQAMALVEKNWKATTHKPYWITNDTILFDPVVNQVKADPTLKARLALIAFGPPETTSTYVRYNLNYDSVFGADLEAQRSLLSSATYDATYLMFYALASLGNNPVTPLNVGKAYRNAADPSAPPVQVGLDGINDGLTILGRGEKIKFVGTWGSPVFNEQGSNVNGDAPVFCIDPTRTPALADSGYRFDTAGNLTVPMTSPCNF